MARDRRSDQPGNDVACFAADLRAAMRRMPGAVSIVTTRHPGSREPMGLAASAIIPVAMDPPSMLVSINRSASAHPAIVLAGQFCVNLLHVEQRDLVETFGSSALRDRRFESALWDLAGDLPRLSSAAASICCRVRQRTVFGTHELFIGEVTGIALDRSAEPLAWLEGGFGRITSLVLPG